MAFFINVPARLQKGLQRRLWRIDPEAVLVTRPTPDRRWNASVNTAGRLVRRICKSTADQSGVAEPVYHCLTLSGTVQGCALMLEPGRYAVAIWLGAMVRF